ncbi:helix-turn-helix domain-containing protein [Caulobacter segnis]|uniref:Helix-turn-helix domain-containing protein n=1 Tax=Caulobacter segnis TaxID=88688 RepID=A0A2W5V8F8_9CAUL|nr:helix-turn-helix domain-containing protein [Caulobacter segnis]PZR35502.1 MAG: helix-turn-helix domain-containing protein [Caulobacter segnis]
MADTATPAPTGATVVDFPKAPKKVAPTEKIWGKAVTSHGYAGVPNILIRSQARLGLSPLQFNIVVQLLEYYHDPSRPPFPSKEELAGRMGVKAKTIQTNMRALEKAGLVRRELRKTAAGDWNSNLYHLDGLIAKVMALEPEFAKVREERKAAKRAVETPAGKRAAAKAGTEA